MDTIVPSEELEMMIDTDVVIGIAGPDLFHILFLCPGSAVIAYHQPYISDLFWNKLAEVSQLAYYPIYNYSTPYPGECGDIHSNTCISYLKQQPIYLSHGQLHNYMRVASIHVHMNKYRSDMVLQ